MLRRIWTVIDERLIRPFRESHAPVEEVALGAVVGIFWALTPLVGIQMYLVFMTWTVARLMRIRLSLTVGLALVWITNPITMPIFYYGFYETGRFLLQFLNLVDLEPITLHRISVLVEAAGERSLIDGLIFWFKTFLRDFGLPSLIGGFLWGALVSAIAYPFTIRMMNNHRSRLAKKEGLTLQEWEAIHVQRFGELIRQNVLPAYAGEHEAPAESVARPSSLPVKTVKKKKAKRKTSSATKAEKKSKKKTTRATRKVTRSASQKKSA